ncbi:MAG: hypothetical protein EXR79_06150 [Myxococcales bacterium]|nr:hypothetical protein [Myxococcales bacterium]
MRAQLLGARAWTARARTAVALVAGLIVAATPGVHALTSAIDSGESVLVGPKAVVAEADVLGAWLQSGERIGLRSADPGQHHWWLPRGSAAQLGDGFARFRVDVPRAGRVGLVVRATVALRDVGASSGYALSIGKGDIGWQRCDRGRWRPLDRPTPVPALATQQTVEVQVWMVGPHLGAEILDGATLSPLASASATDRTYATGRVGLYVFSRKGTGPALTRLSTRPAALPKVQGAVPYEPTGGWRFARWTPAAAANLPPPLRTQASPVDGVTGVPPVWKLSVAAAEWAAREHGRSVALAGDVPVGWLDPSWPDAARLDGELQTMTATSGGRCRIETIGRTHQGRPLRAVRAARPGADRTRQPAVLLSGGIHGDELLAVAIAMDAAAALCRPDSTDPGLRAWADALHVWIVPVVNPDGIDAFLHTSEAAGRKNGQGHGDPELGGGAGVDLNRNFPFHWGALGEVGSRSPPRDDWYRGPRPGSEPETQALMALAERERFVAALSLHTWGTVVLAPYTIDGVRGPEPDEAWAVALDVARAAPVQPNGRRYRVQRNIYPVDGVEQDWLRHTYGTVALLAEAALHNPFDRGQRTATIEATRPLWRALLGRVAAGPRVSGRAFGADGRPAHVEVRVAGQVLHEGERWTTRPDDGRFDRLLARTGPATLQFVRPGLPTLELALAVTGVVENLDVRLP